MTSRPHAGRDPFVWRGFSDPAWCRLRGIPLFDRDGTLWYDGRRRTVRDRVHSDLSGPPLHDGHARRFVIYLAPFFVVLGARIVLPADQFGAAQWLGLGLSFAGMLVPFGLPMPALDPRQHTGDVMMVVAALFWAATTLTIKASPLTRASAEKVMLFQLVVPGHMAIAAIVSRRTHDIHAVGHGDRLLVYQTVWVVSVTFVIWFALMARYSATRFSAFTSHATVRRSCRTWC